MAFAVLLAALICAANLDVVLGPRSFFYRDFGLFGYPNAHYLKQSLCRGEVPLWNPLSNCGLPFLAQWNTMTLYPLSLFCVLFPLPWSLCIFNLAHLFLAGVGMYAVARRWTQNELAAGVAGAAFACNGLALHCLMWPNNIAALGWMPWVVLSVEQGWRHGKERMLIGAGVAALQAFTGAPEIILLTWSIVAGLLIGTLWNLSQSRWRVLCRAGATGLLAAGLAAIQLLPFLDLLWHSQRNRLFGGDAWSMPIWGWANLIVPLFHCSPSRLGVFSQADQQWTSSYYLGIGTLALALIAVAKVQRLVTWYFALIGLTGLVLALGHDGLILSWLEDACPALRLVRFPIKFVVLTVFAVPLLAALGLDSIQREAAKNAKQVRWCLLASGLLLLISIVGLVWIAHHHPAPEEPSFSTLRSGWTRAVFLLLTLLSTSWLAHPPYRTRWNGLLLVALIGLDGLTHMPRQNPTVPREAFGPLQVSMTLPPRDGEVRAMLSSSRRTFLENASSSNPAETVIGQRQALFANCNLVEGIPKVDGFYSLYLKEESEVRSLFYRSTNTFYPRLADFLGVVQLSSPIELFGWSKRSSALPLVTAGQQPLFANAEETMKGLTAPDFDPRRVVYLPEEAFGQVGSSSFAAILHSERHPHRIEAEVEADGPALVVIAEAFYHHWQASVDGHPTPLWRANHAFQALEVPRGRHRVQLVYRDQTFHAGGTITAFSLFVWLAAWLRLRLQEIRMVPARRAAPYRWIASDN